MTGAIGDRVTASDADNDVRLYTLTESETNPIPRTDGKARFEIDDRSGQISVTKGTVLNFSDPDDGHC